MECRILCPLAFFSKRRGTITVVFAVYFYNFRPAYLPLKKSVLKVRSFMRDILASLDRENVGWKMVYTFLGNDEKTLRNLCFLSLKTSLWKRSQTFFRVVYRNKYHVTIHTDKGQLGLQELFFTFIPSSTFTFNV